MYSAEDREMFWWEEAGHDLVLKCDLRVIRLFEPFRIEMRFC
jgi:hypothetical protein